MVDRAERSRVAAAVPSAYAILGIVLIAVNLRASITSVGPILDTIRSDVGLSAAGAGALTMLPLLGFAGISPLAPAIARRLGLERSLVIALAVLAAGIVLRSVPGWVPLFGGTALIGAAIGTANVLLPGLAKRDYPDRAAALTGLYTTTMGLFAMISSGISAPITAGVPGGWRTMLGGWVLIALIALAVWLPRLRGFSRATAESAGESARAAAEPPVRPRPPWRSPLAWQLTAFMGLQSMGFYVCVAWLPTILHSYGVGATAAGWHVALMQFAGLLASAGSSAILGRLADQRYFAAGVSLLGALSYAGLVVVPDLGLMWSVLFGLSQGACITLALSFFALRARDPGQAAALSGMGQSLGYLFAAFGPLLFGVLHDGTGGWTVPVLILVGVALVQSVVAMNAGRARYVD